MDVFIHVANVLYLASYLVRDIFWLRILTVVAGATLIPYFLLVRPPLTAPIVWNVVFIAINFVQIWRLYLERRPVVLREEEQRLYQAAFRCLTPREFLRLLGLGRWEDAAQGARLVEQGTTLDRILVIHDGTTTVQVDGREVATLGPGCFVGEMSYLTGAPSTANVDAATPIRYVAWPRGALDVFLRRNPDLRAALQFVISRDLVAKLRTA